MKKLILTSLLFGSLAACSQPAPVTGDSWTLDGTASDITFLSTKNGDVTEISRFETVSGTVAPDGQARLIINPASVETYVDIRNERLRDLFFDVSRHAAIEVSTRLDPAAYENLIIGAGLEVEITVSVVLGGEARTIYAPVRVLRVEADQIHVISAEPALIDARDFGLEDAVIALRDIASLDSIAPVFPVNVHLVFQRD